jgi:hypothetical protein
MSIRRRFRGAGFGIFVGAAPAMILSAFTVLLGACATERGAAAAELPRATALDTEPWAIDDVSGGDEELTLSLAQEVQRTSGAPVVTKQQVANELNECGDEPCPTIMRDLFTSAPVVIVANVAAAGKGFLATGNARKGARILKRASASGRTADEAVRGVAAALGEGLREMKLGGEL